MQSSREIVIRTITFDSPPRLAIDLPPEYGSDFAETGMTPSPDYRPSQGVDQWGAVWENIGVCKLGEVEKFPLERWEDFDRLRIPDIHDPSIWIKMDNARRIAGDKFLLADGISLYERVHFIRGLENTWMDIFEERDNLCRLIDILVEMNLVAIERFSRAGIDALYITDDWGLQNRLMISPQSWRDIWKPAYKRVFEAAHAAGLYTFLHSCGYIIEIMDDLIEIGLDVIQMDQQENMGLELLGDRFRGRITFFCPVDIQATMARGNPDEIVRYCRKMFECLCTPSGGLIPRWYSDPVGAGHSDRAIRAMSEEFLSLSQSYAGRS